MIFLNRRHRLETEATARLGRVGRYLLIGMLLSTAASCSSKPPSEPDYPSRPIRLIVPFSAGGGTDTFARIMKTAVEQNDLLPVPLAIVNQPGAGATDGSRRVKNAAPDGYTLLLLHDAIITAELAGLVDYGPEAFEPVAGTGEVGMVVAVREEAPFETLTDLLEAAARHPDSVTFAANLGAMTHFAGLQLEKAYNERRTNAGAPPGGARFRFVQFGGGAERFAALQGGHVDVTGFSIEEFARFRSEGLRGLAYFGRTRHPAASDVPTARESGFELVEGNTFYWWFPKGTPADRIRVAAEALRAAMQTDYVREKLAEIHCQPLFVEGVQLERRLERSIAQLAGVAPRANVVVPDLPRWLLAASVLLAGVVLLESLWSRLGRPRERRVAGRPRGPVRLAMLCFALTLTYVALLSRDIEYRWLTLAFVLALGGLLVRGERRLWLPLAMAALVMSFGLDLIFTHWLGVDLPG